MRKQLLFLFGFLTIQLLHAQTVEWSNPQKVKSKSNYTQILGENASGIFTLRAKNNLFNRDLIIEKYRSNLAADKSIELWQPAGSYLERIFMRETELIAFGSAKSNVTESIELFYWKVDENLGTNMQTTPLLKVDANRFKDNNIFYIRNSSDKSKFAVLYITTNADNTAGVLNVCGFDNRLSQRFFKQYPLPYHPADIFITTVECDNDGNIFMLIDFPKQNIKRKSKQSNRQFFLYSFMVSEQSLLEYEIGDDSTIIMELGLAVNNYDKSVSVAGFYQLQNMDKKLAGSFLYTIDIQSAQTRVKTFELFDKSFVNKVSGTMLNEQTAGLSDLYIRKLIPRSDGGCVIVAEKYYESRQSYTYYVNGFPQTSTRTVYNFDEIVVFSIKPDGTTEYNTFIKKNQSSVNDGGYYSSFALVNTNDKLAFIYNADVSNEGDVMISTVDPKGSTDTRVLIKSMSYYVALMPPEARQVSGNSTLICTLKDRRFSIMRLIF